MSCVRSILSGSAGVLLALTVVGAQIPTDIDLPGGWPATMEKTTFATRDALAVKSGAVIHVAKDLPLAATFATVTMSGSFAPVGDWTRLSPSRACYTSVGNDLQPNTADDRLVLVAGLPADPVLVPTGIADLGTPCVPVHDELAFRIDEAGQAIDLISHDDQGISLEQISAPLPLIVHPDFPFGAADGDTILGISPGADLGFGTGDDRVLRLRNLQNGAHEWSETPLAQLAQGLVFAESGAAVAWSTNIAPDILLQVFLPSPALAPATLLVSPPIQGLPASFDPCSVRPGIGDTVIASCRDQMGPGEAHVIVRDLSAVPSITSGWYDDWNGGMGSEVIGETEIVTYSAMGPFGFDYVDLLNPSANRSFSFNWSNYLSFHRPNPATLVVFGDDYWLGQANSFVVRDLGGTMPTTTAQKSGCWVGGTWTPRFITLSEGRVAGFISDDGPNAPESLRILSAPGLWRSGDGVVEGGMAPLSLDVSPAVYGPGDTIHLQLDTGLLQPDLAWLLISLDAHEHVFDHPAFAVGSVLRIDPVSALIVDMPLSAGQSQLSVPVSALEDPAIGLDFHAQGLCLDMNGLYHFSEAWTVIAR